MKLAEKLLLVAEWLKNEDNALLVSAEEDGEEIEKYALAPGHFEAPHEDLLEGLEPVAQKQPQAASVQSKPQANYRSPAGTVFNPTQQDRTKEAQKLFIQWYGAQCLGPSGADGKLGPFTEAAISKFQEQNTIPRTGQLDNLTWEHIDKAARNQPKTAQLQSNAQQSPKQRVWPEAQKAQALAATPLHYQYLIMNEDGTGVSTWANMKGGPDTVRNPIPFDPNTMELVGGNMSQDQHLSAPADPAKQMHSQYKPVHAGQERSSLTAQLKPMQRAEVNNAEVLAYTIYTDFTPNPSGQAAPHPGAKAFYATGANENEAANLAAKQFFNADSAKQMAGGVWQTNKGQQFMVVSPAQRHATQRSLLTIVAQSPFNQSSNSAALKPFVDVLAKALREYTATEWTPAMKQSSNELVRFDPTRHSDEASYMGSLARDIASQPWGKDPAIREAAFNLWQTSQNSIKQQKATTHANNERSTLTIVAQQSPSLKPYIAALAGAMRRYTATEWTPEMKQMSDQLVTHGESANNPGEFFNFDFGSLAQEVAKQPWGKDPAVNKAATDLWQACQNASKQPQTHANNERSPLTIVAEALVAASDLLIAASEEVAAMEPDVITADALDELAAVAESFDNSDDELLRKQASVLDAVLEMFAVKKNAKEAEAEKIDQLKLKYKTPQEVDHKRNHIAEAVSDIEKSPMYKDRRVLSTPLSCRSCPDHASSAMARVGENTYQCQLDKRVYNYDEGYTLLDGTKVAGSSVSGQTQNLWSNIGNPVFDTRGDRTGQSSE